MDQTSPRIIADKKRNQSYQYVHIRILIWSKISSPYLLDEKLRATFEFFWFFPQVGLRLSPRVSSDPYW
jgi:hypothetical protein